MREIGHGHIVSQPCDNRWGSATLATLFEYGDDIDITQAELITALALTNVRREATNTPPSSSTRKTAAATRSMAFMRR